MLLLVWLRLKRKTGDTMGVKLVYGLDIDKLPAKNTCDSLIRFFAPALVKLRFIDENTGRIIFSYAPRNKDKEIILAAFQLIDDYDVKRKDFGDFVTENLIVEHVKGVVKE